MYFQLIPKSLLVPNMVLFLCASKMHHQWDGNCSWQDYTQYQPLRCYIKKYITLNGIIQKAYKFYIFVKHKVEAY